MQPAKGSQTKHKTAQTKKWCKLARGVEKGVKGVGVYQMIHHIMTHYPNAEN
jgi:hypothetical protein